MSITITGKLKKPANKFSAGEYTGFGVRLGVQYYDRKTKQREWTNYTAVLFASQPAKIKYYEDVLIEGAVIELTGENAKIDSYEGQNGVSLSIELLNTSLGFTYTGEQSSLQQQSKANQAHQNMNVGSGVDDQFADSDIPF